MSSNLNLISATPSEIGQSGESFRQRTTVSLGKPLPNSQHAVSVSLPLWEDVLGYEEKDERVMSALRNGYPRFFLQPLIRLFFDRAARQLEAPDGSVIAFPSKKAMAECIQYVRESTGIATHAEPVEGEFWAASFPGEAYDFARRYWQHCGEIITTRQVDRILSNAVPDPEEATAKDKLRARIASYVNVSASDVFLFPTGMSATKSAYDLVAYRDLESKKLRNRGIQFGFPYLDTLKLQIEFGIEPFFFPQASEKDLEKVRSLISEGSVSYLITEAPTNPLLHTPDLEVLHAMLSPQALPLIVDDTIGSYFNINAINWADIVVTSLTKFFSGWGDVAGGALILNPASQNYSEFKKILCSDYQDTLSSQDALALLKNSEDFQDRMTVTNKNAEILADFLNSHPKVQTVYYPKFVDTAVYNKLRRPGGGYGGLLSILLNHAENSAPKFYDSMKLSKGPGLGTNFTLLCPYTLLAHYGELEWAESVGVSRYLVRVSVGNEDITELLKLFTEALENV